MAHRERFEVAFHEVDMMGHVNNAAYFTYFETARTNYILRLKQLSPPFAADQLDIIVARATCDFHRGLRWGEKAECVVWPSRLGETSFDFSYRITDAVGALAAEGLTVQVSFDYARNRKQPIPAAFRRALDAEREQGPG